VIVCGNNMGDIFRRNALNLGLHVVQSPEAVADAQDGDQFEFDPVSRRLSNVTRAKTYEPLPPFFVALAVYLPIVFVLVSTQRRLERRMARSTAP